MKKYNLLNEIYYSEEYVSLYLKEGETLFVFKYQEGKSFFVNIAIKRPIKQIGDICVCDGYFDIETAYGYGGYYTNTENQEFLRQALHAYQIKCKEEKIISEFIRFHPYNNFPINNKNYFDFLLVDRDAVSVDLSIPTSERRSHYNESTRRKIKKASSVLRLEESLDIVAFMELYNFTMKKNNANDFYYFPYDYYANLLMLKNVRLFAVFIKDQIVHMSIYFFGKDFVHYHLGANSNEHLSLNGNTFVFDAVSNYTKKNFPSAVLLNLGGGRSGATNDSLLAFKSGFSDIRTKFIIAGKVYNQMAYNKYISMFNERNPTYRHTKYFLKYRILSI